MQLSSILAIAAKRRHEPTNCQAFTPVPALSNNLRKTCSPTMSTSHFTLNSQAIISQKAMENVGKGSWWRAVVSESGSVGRQVENRSEFVKNKPEMFYYKPPYQTSMSLPPRYGQNICLTDKEPGGII